MKNIDVTWLSIQSTYDKSLDYKKVVYALLDNHSRIYYIGKADDQTLRERLNDPAKKDLLGILQKYGESGGGVLCGITSSLGNYSLPSPDISNVEALLIREEAPWGNVVKPNVTQDIRVNCNGFWRGKQSVYEYWSRPMLSIQSLMSPVPEFPIQRIARSQRTEPRPLASERSDAALRFSMMMALAGLHQNQGLGFLGQLVEGMKKR